MWVQFATELRHTLRVCENTQERREDERAREIEREIVRKKRIRNRIKAYCDPAIKSKAKQVKNETYKRWMANDFHHMPTAI